MTGPFDLEAAKAGAPVKHLFEKNGVVHACDGSEIHRGIYLVWTKCGMDIPANASFKSNEDPTCAKCLKVIA